MKKWLLALAVIIMVTIPAALASNVEVPLDKLVKGSPTSVIAADKLAGVKFDLSTETFVDSTMTNVAGVSFDGGKKWIAIADVKTADIEKFLKKGGNIQVTTALGSDNKPDAEAGYETVQLKKIEARGKAPKVKPYYFADNTWVVTLDLTKVPSSTDYEKYESVLASADGKASGAYDTVQPLAIRASSSTDKPTYLVRTPASGADSKYTPASASAKVKPAKMGKAPKAKIDYKKEEIKLKKGMYATTTSVWNPDPKGDDKTAKTESVANVIGTDTEMTVWLAATGKKPGTEAFTFAIATRAIAPTGIAIADKGKLDKAAIKPLEMKGTKWGSVKAPSANGSIIVRVKANVKMSKDGKTVDSGNAASPEAKFTIEVGKLDSSDPKSKDGVKSVTLVTGP